MEEIVLKAVHRSDKPGKVRQAGFVPAVLHEKDKPSTPVQLEAAALARMVAHHGLQAHLWIDVDGDRKYGFIKEIQRDPVERKIIHAAVQIVARDQGIKLQVPIHYHGLDILEQRFLQLHISRSQVEVMGPTEKIPEQFVIDTAAMNSGQSVTAADFKLPDGVRSLDSADQVYAVVKQHKGRLTAEEA